MCKFPFIPLLLLALCGSWNTALAEDLPPNLAPLIQKAGNTDSDEDRLAILHEIRKLPGLNEELKEQADSLIAQIDRWVHGDRLEYFGSQVVRGKGWDFGVPEHSPLSPLAVLYFARMELWVTLEYGGYWNTEQERSERFEYLRALFHQVAKNFPENRIIQMVLGEIQPPEKEYPVPANAPEWAVHQREGLQRLASIIHWWIDHRMQEDAQYGGGWGDDCEMWRWWTPVLLGFEDPKINGAQAKFSRALMNREDMRGGYTSHVFDVEHTAEDSADVITPMMHLEPRDPEWSNKAKRLVELFETLWSGVNDRGFLQFKSTYFSVNKVDPDPRKACDTVYHPRALQPALLYWQRTGDPWVGGLVTRWMDTWVEATAREERGKPAGIIPSAIHWPDGGIGGTGENWWDPENHSSDPLYVWPSAMSQMTNTLLLTYHMTSDEKYLAPIRSMAAIRLDYLKNVPQGEIEPGSQAWCASKLGSLSGVLQKYRMLTGSEEFDELLKKDADAYMVFRETGNRESLNAALRGNGEALRINFPGYTSEVRFTDRVLRFPTVFGRDRMVKEGVPEIRSPQPEVLYSSATGDPGTALYFPMNAVRWLTPPKDIAALVTESGPGTFEAEMFQFGDETREMGAEFFLLEGNQANWKLSVDGEIHSEGVVDLESDPVKIMFEMPSGKVCKLKMTVEE